MKRHLTVIAIALAVLGLAVQRGLGPGMHRPLQHDELLTVTYYTWAGLKPSGEGQTLGRVHDIRNLPPPGLRLLGMGVYRSLGVWREPNNHIVNSLLLGLALAPGHPSEISIRLPALLGAVALAGAVWWVYGPVLGWTAAAPILALLSFCCPYVVTFSQTARGYTWMLALQYLAIGCACRLAHRPTSVAWGAACAAVAIVSFSNIFVLALVWVLPFYVALWFSPPPRPGADPTPADWRPAWRTSLGVQALVIGTIGMYVLIDRLPYIYSSVRQYGIPLAGGPGLVGQLAGTFRYLFPDLFWTATGLAGLAGTVALFRAPRYRFLGIAGVLSLALSVAYAILAGRMIYERTCGYFLPIILSGLAYGLESLYRALAAGRQRLLFWTGGTALVLVAIGTAIRQEPESDPRVPAFLALVAELNQQDGPPHVIVLPPSAELFRYYLPPGWLDSEDRWPAEGPLRLCLFTDQREQLTLEMQQGPEESRIQRPLPCLAGADAPASGRHRLPCVEAAAAPLGADQADGFPALVVWQPATDRLGLDAGELMDLVQGSGLPYIRHNIRVPIKVDFYSRLHALDFLACTPAELVQIRTLVQQGIARFGGTARVYRPTADRDADAAAR